MPYSTAALDLVVCLWQVFKGIAVGVFRFILPPKHKNVAGAKVLITGAGNGLGRLLCVQFARLGSEIIAWDIDENGLKRTKEEVEYLGAKIHTFKCDLSHRDDVIETASRVRQTVGDVDIVINNAGMVVGKTLREHTPNDVIRTFNVNVLSQFWTAECFLPAMIARNSGHIVSVSSVAGYFGVNRMGSYCASKFAVNGYMESLRYELCYAGHSGVHTTTVCPYFMNTDLFKGCTIKFPLLFPRLEPGYVAKRTVQAILTNQVVVCIPRTFYALSVVKALLPVESMTAVHRFIGAGELMNTFQGRKPAEKTDGVTENAELTSDKHESTTENNELSPAGNTDEITNSFDRPISYGITNGNCINSNDGTNGEVHREVSPSVNKSSLHLRQNVEKIRSAEA